MANFYCDISAVGAAGEYQAYAAVPTIGALATDRPRPMDGNGEAQSATAASVAIAELIITTLPTDGLTLSIGGSAAITAKTTVAAKNQFAIGASIATATTNLTALLNTFGTTSNTCDVAAVAAVSQALLAIPYLYYARVKPGTSNTIQLFTRIAGADFNTAINSTSKVTQTGSWLNSGAASINFTEGVDGPFGYLFNVQGVMFGKTGGTNAAPLWGIAPSKSGAPTDPGINDVIYVRTKRSGADLSLSHTSNVAFSYQFTPSTVARNFVFDDGVIWPDDNGQFTIITRSQSGSSSHGFAWSGPLRFIAKAKYGFKVNFANTLAPLGFTFSGGGQNNHLYIENCLFEDDLGVNLGSLAVSAPFGGNGNNFRMVGCKLSFKSTIRQLFIPNGGGGFGHAVFDSCIFEAAAASSGILVGGGSASMDQTVEFVNCNFTDRNNLINPILTSPIGPTLYPNASQRVVFDGCTGVAPFTGGLAAQQGRVGMQFIYRMPGTDGAWRVETGAWVSEWRNDANIPYLNGLLPSGTPYSIKTMIRDCADTGISLTPLTLNAQLREASAVKTITVQLLVPTGAVFKKTGLGLIISYTKVDGTVAQQSTFESQLNDVLGTATSLPASTANWSMNGTSGFTPVYLDITTEHAILTGTNVIIRLVSIGRPAGSVDRTLFVCPEPVFS